MRADASYHFLLLCTNIVTLMRNRGNTDIQLGSGLADRIREARKLVEAVEDGVVPLGETNYRHLVRQLKNQVNQADQIFLTCRQPARGNMPLCVMLFTDKMGVKVVQALKDYADAHGVHDFVLVAKTGATACAKKSLITQDYHVEVFKFSELYYLAGSHCLTPSYTLLRPDQVIQALGIPERQLERVTKQFPTLRCDLDIAVRQAGLRSGDIVSFQRCFPGIQTQTVFKQVSGGSNL
jgi:hypothetical protein